MTIISLALFFIFKKDKGKAIGNDAKEKNGIKKLSVPYKPLASLVIATLFPGFSPLSYFWKERIASIDWRGRKDYEKTYFHGQQTCLVLCIFHGCRVIGNNHFEFGLFVLMGPAGRFHRICHDADLVFTIADRTHKAK